MLTQKELKDYLEYDKDSGLFTRKVSNNTRHKIGEVAGYLGKDGYRRLAVKGITYSEHRLAWLYVYGKFPELILDHIDGNPSNNKISNLREVTQNQNQYNSKLRKDSSSGIKNVRWSKWQNKWQVTVKVLGKEKFFGYFEDLEFAELVATEVREKYHGIYANHG
jgi:hypothetical protein